MVRSPKVRLYIRIRTSQGKDAFAEPVWSRNGSLRAGYAMVDGKPEQHSEGVYYLRYQAIGQSRRWANVGSDSDRAVAALRNLEHDLQAVSLGRSVPALLNSPAAPEPVKAEVSLEDAKTIYLEEVKRFRAAKTIAAATAMLERLTARFPEKLLTDLTRADLLDHMGALKAEGLGDRTIHNHICRIETFLKQSGVTGLLKRQDKPRYDEKEVAAYDEEDLGRLFSAATAEERQLFEFFLATGFREQEVEFCTWRNIDFRGKVVSVKSKPELGFRVKDKEERSVPVPDGLIASLAERKRLSTSMLVFPSEDGKPDGHMLRKLQQLALRAGLNCGECLSKKGKSCRTHPNCGEWGLYKFRKTFATLHSQSGVSVRNIQLWLGHSDLSTTLRYLAVADMRSERTRSQVNASFTVLGQRGAA